MTPEARRARAYAARAMIDDQMLQQGWAEIERDLREEWEACWLPRKRDRIWNQLRHLKSLRKKIGSYAGHARD